MKQLSIGIYMYASRYVWGKEENHNSANANEGEVFRSKRNVVGGHLLCQY